MNCFFNFAVSFSEPETFSPQLCFKGVDQAKQESFSSLKGAIDRENGLLRLKPFKIAEEYC